MFTRKAVQPSKISKPRGVFSAAIVVENPGKLVFLSGFTSRDENGEVVHPDLLIEINAIAALP